MKIFKILLVEDNASDAELLRQALCLTGDSEFVLTHRERLEHAASTLNEEEIDLVLLDLSLPDSHGLETFSQLHGLFPNIAIVILSGTNDVALATEAVRLGAQDYLVKEDANPEIIERAIKYAIARKEIEIDLRHAKDSAEAATAAKTEFMNNISKVVQAPLEWIIGMCDLAVNDDDPNTRKDHLELIKTSAESLLSLVGDISGFSRIEPEITGKPPRRYETMKP